MTEVRLALLEELFAPMMLGQRARQFVLVMWADSQLPPAVLARIGAAFATHPNFYLATARALAQPSLFKPTPSGVVRFGG